MLFIIIRINETDEVIPETVDNSLVNETFISDTDIQPTDGQHLGINAKGSDFEDGTFGLWTGSKKSDLVSGIGRVALQFEALFVKRFINSIRNKALIVSQLIVPIFILLVNLSYVKWGPIKAEGNIELKALD